MTDVTKKLQKAVAKTRTRTQTVANLGTGPEDVLGAGIKVCVRVRPFIKEEIEGDRSGGKCECCIEMPTVTCTVMKRPDEERAFEFDRCFWSHSKNHPLFANQQTIQDELGETMLDWAIKGFNNCIFAYGQTGSGKSYSVLGGPGDDRGLLPRIVEGLFQKFEQIPEDVKKKTLVSFMEIYLMEIRDLLCEKSSDQKAEKKLDVRVHPTLGLTIPGLKEWPVDSGESVMKLVELGQENRRVSATAMNASSSRSHCVFTFKTGLVEPDGTTKTSQTHLVDLAGSERASRTKAEGERLKEGAAINKALSTLARVISELAKAGNKKSNPPFRDSKLTHVLKEALCGNSKTVMMAAISPSAIDFDETLSTMKFCQQVKLVQTKAVANTVNENGIEAALRREAEELRSKLAIAEANAATSGTLATTQIAEVEKLLSKHGEGRVSLIVQRLQQTEQLSKFYGNNYDTWLAEEQRSIKRREATINVMPDQLEQLEQLRVQFESGASGSDSGTDLDGDSDRDSDAKANRTGEYVLCHCLTREAVASGSLVSNLSQHLPSADDDKSKIIVTGPIARELRSALEQSKTEREGNIAKRTNGEYEEREDEDSQELIDRTAEHKTKSLAKCWNDSIEAERLVRQLSKPGAPKVVLTPHVAVRPDEIDLTCEVIISAEYNDESPDGGTTCIREWFAPTQVGLLLKWLRESLEAAGLNDDEHGTYANAWEAAVSTLTGHATRGKVKEMETALSMAPRRSKLDALSAEMLAERTKLAEAKDEAAATDVLRRELAQQREMITWFESQASKARRTQASLVSETAEELQRERDRAQQLQVKTESQRGGLEMQRSELDALKRAAAEADGLRGRAETLRAELASAEDRLSASQRSSEEARDLRARLLDAEGRLLFTETRVGEADQLRAECQQAEGKLRILQGRSDEAQRLREELDRAHAQLAELPSQPHAAPEGAGGELEQLRAELGAAEVRVADAERLRAALAATAAELREAQARSSQVDQVSSELSAMQQSVQGQRRQVEEANRLRGEFQVAEQELGRGRAAEKEVDRLRGELATLRRQLGGLQHSVGEARGAQASEAQRRATAVSSAEAARRLQEESAAAARVEMANYLQQEAAALREQRAICDEATAETHALRSELGALQGEVYAQRRRDSNSSHLRAANESLQMELTAQHLGGGQLEAQRLRAELAAAEGQLETTRRRLEVQEAMTRAHREASSMLLDARSARGGAKMQSLAGEIASSFEAAIEAIDLAKQELVKEGSVRRR
ncbi:unnamed protein product [Prorocentrum cordatum]|uniref:Kinesin motor domain-containing protein n=1 Tax=Prorocentrum cordatum TaxID=2364126 RepID=A0ABN9QHN9_9DINO|nr:unnamed protein product [Polarella glacialis]